MEGATNTQPSSTEQVGDQPLKPSQRRSVNSARPVKIQQRGTYNVRCLVCRRFIAINLDHPKQADHLIDEHESGTKCCEARVELVKPQEPKEDQDLDHSVYCFDCGQELKTGLDSKTEAIELKTQHIEQTGCQNIAIS